MTGRNKYYIADVEIFPIWHEYPFVARLHWQATPTYPLGIGAHRNKNGSPDISGKPQEGIENDPAVIQNGIIKTKSKALQSRIV